MNTPQPAALPECIAHVEDWPDDRTPIGLVWDVDPASVPVGTKLYALQSQPAADVSDADIYALWVKHCETPGTTTRQLVCGFARAILALRPAAQTERDTGPRVLREVFALCEDTIDKMAGENTEFSRGRAFEAKGISRAIGTWFQDEYCGRSYMGEPSLPAPQQATPAQAGEVDEREHPPHRLCGCAACRPSFEDAAISSLPTQPAAQATPEPCPTCDSLRKDFARECVDTDTLLRLLGFVPEEVRTDGGSLNLMRLASLIEARKATPEPRLFIGACITDGRLHATVQRLESNGHVTLVATAEMDAASLHGRDCIAQMKQATPEPVPFSHAGHFYNLVAHALMEVKRPDACGHRLRLILDELATLMGQAATSNRLGHRLVPGLRPWTRSVVRLSP